MVKRLRLRPFTAATRVRVPSGSPPHFPAVSPTWRHSSAGRASASHAEGHRFEFCCLHHIATSPNRKVRTCWFSALFGGTPPPTGQAADWSSVVTATLKQARTERFGLVGFLSCSAVHRLQRVRPLIRVLITPQKGKDTLKSVSFLLLQSENRG